MTVIHILGAAIGVPTELDDTYLAAYDPDANKGHGAIVGTKDRDRALQFDSAGAAFTYWRRTSTVAPLRPDGRPNRPLTAYTVEFVP